MESRVISVPTVILGEEDWRTLRRLAIISARFGNEYLAATFARFTIGADGFDIYKKYNKALSHTIRDAITRECVGIWRRNGRKIVTGRARLAVFTADRALVVRDKGIRVRRGGPLSFSIDLKLWPRPTPDFRLDVFALAVKKRHDLRELLDRFAAGETKVSKATIRFDRPGRKITLLLSYAVQPAEIEPGSRIAELVPLEDPFVACEGRRLSIAAEIYRLRLMRDHFAAIQSRIRRALGRRGSWHRMRQILAAHGNYSQWAEGPLHQLSRKIVNWCLEQEAGVLNWRLAGDGTWPADRLASAVAYKCRDAGIKFVKKETETDDAEKEDAKNVEAPKRKASRRRKMPQ